MVNCWCCGTQHCCQHTAALTAYVLLLRSSMQCLWASHGPLIGHDGELPMLHHAALVSAHSASDTESGAHRQLLGTMVNCRCCGTQCACQQGMCSAQSGVVEAGSVGFSFITGSSSTSSSQRPLRLHFLLRMLTWKWLGVLMPNQPKMRVSNMLPNSAL